MEDVEEEAHSGVEQLRDAEANRQEGRTKQR